MNETILLVEDDENDVFFFKRAAKLAGLLNPVQVASDGRQAIQYLGGIGEYSDRAQFPLPCLVLLDLKLPHVMGLDVLQWVRAQSELNAVIVLVFTSSKLRPDIHRAYSLGANSYLVKPSSPADLPEMIRQIKHYWLQMNVAAPAPEYAGLPARVANISVFYETRPEMDRGERSRSRLEPEEVSHRRLTV